MGAILLSIALAAVLYVAADKLLANTYGKLVLFAGVVLVPLAVSVGGLGAGVVQSSETRFCLSCHEMQPYGKSLFVDSPTSLASVHFQNRLINRDYSCYVCHKDYAMFGDAKAKLNGLRHVWVHYLGDIPEKFELYSPYSNNNCMHCHDDARSYLEVGMHQDHQQAIVSGERSCLSCHQVSHDMDNVHKGAFWQALRE